MGMYTEMNTEQELADVKKIIENAGYYWVHQTRDEFEATKADPKADRQALQARRLPSASRSGSNWPTSVSRARATRCTSARATTTGGRSTT